MGASGKLDRKRKNNRESNPFEATTISHDEIYAQYKQKR